MCSIFFVASDEEREREELSLHTFEVSDASSQQSMAVFLAPSLPIPWKPIKKCQQKQNKTTTNMFINLSLYFHKTITLLDIELHLLVYLYN